MNFRKTPHSIVLVFLLILGSCITGTFALLDYRETRAEAYQSGQETLTKITSRVESIIYQKMSVIPAIISLVRAEKFDLPHDKDQLESFRPVFEKFAEELNTQIKGVLSIQLAPDGVVTLITNINRNKAALGHDLLVDDNRREQVIEAITRRDQLTAGPLELIQGGQAIISRKAIFSQIDTRASERYTETGRVDESEDWLSEIPSDFWGLATIIVDITSIYNEAKLTELSGDYNLAIRGRNGLGQQGDVFWGSASVFNDALATQAISVPGGSWYFAIERQNSFLTRNFFLIIIFGSTLTFLLMYAYHSQRERARVTFQSQAKSDFLTKMSHELRTPLNGIIGFTDIMHRSKEQLPEKHQRCLKHIHSSGKFLLTLINDLMDLSLIESGKLTLTKTQFNLFELIEDSIAMLQNVADEKQIFIERVWNADKDLNINTDKDRLQQVIINLLSNAIKYNTHKGTVTITINDLDEEHLAIDFSDTGCGIPSEKLGSLFTMFERLHNDNSIQGAGVGLVIVRGLVDLMRGSITVKSQVDGGTKFTLKIPKT